MRNIIILVFLLICSITCGQKVYAQEPPPEDEDVKDIFAVKEDAVTKINSIVQRIYDQALAAKEKSKELADFEAKCLGKNDNGFLTITYETQVASAGGKTTLYAFKLDVEPLENKTYKSHDGYFRYPMPALDLQFSGYVIKHPLRRQFDLEMVLDKYTNELADYQQQFLPLRFVIVPQQNVYRVHEPIRFQAVLANVSQANMLVKGLSEETLFFTLNNAFWGTSPDGVEETLSPKQLRQRQREEARQARAEARAAQKNAREIERRLKKGLGLPTEIGKKTHVKDKIILRAQEALTIDFIGEGYKRAQDVEIRGIYLESIKGLKPTGKFTLKIVE